MVASIGLSNEYNISMISHTHFVLFKFKDRKRLMKCPTYLHPLVGDISQINSRWLTIMHVL